MSFFIDARLEDGKPHLTVTDAESGRLCIDWIGLHVAPGYAEPHLQQEIQQLFKQLILLASVNDTPQSTQGTFHE